MLTSLTVQYNLQLNLIPVKTFQLYLLRTNMSDGIGKLSFAALLKFELLS